MIAIASRILLNMQIKITIENRNAASITYEIISKALAESALFVASDGLEAYRLVLKDQS